MNAEKIKDNLSLLCTLIEEPVDREDMGGVVEKGLRLSEMIALGATCESIAKMRADEAYRDQILLVSKSEASKSLSSTAVLKVAQGNASKEFALYEYAVRLNRSASHVLDYLRSVISLHKEELNSI